MTAVAGSRLLRPGTWALIATLVALLVAPVLTPAPSADAKVLGVDVNPCHVGGIVQDACDTGGDLASDGIHALGGLADGVGSLAAGAWNTAKPFLKAAAALGVGIGAWVACSKIVKAGATAAAAAAATPESAGTATLAGAAGGKAAAGALCMVLKKGGKLVLKVGKKGGKLANLAKLAAGATGLAALFYGTEHAASWILENALDVNKPSAPHLGAPWVAQIRSSLNGMAGVLLIVAAILGLMFAAFRGRTSSVGRILTGMVGAALVIGITGSLLFSSLQVSDAVSAGAVKSQWGQKALGNWTDLGDSYAGAAPGKDLADKAKDAAQGAAQGTPPDDGKGPWILRFLIAIVTVFAGALVWIELQIRDALLLLLLAFSGLMLAGYAFERLRGLATSFAMTMLGVVVAKPILVVTLLLGGAEMQNAAAGGDLLPLLTGAGLMLLAGVLGMKVVTWMGFHGAQVVDSGASIIRNRGRGGGQSSGIGGAIAERIRGGSSAGGGAPEGAPGSGQGDGAVSGRMRQDAANRVGDTALGGIAGAAGAAAAANGTGDSSGTATRDEAMPEATAGAETNTASDGAPQARPEELSSTGAAATGAEGEATSPGGGQSATAGSAAAAPSAAAAAAAGATAPAASPGATGTATPAAADMNALSVGDRQSSGGGIVGDAPTAATPGTTPIDTGTHGSANPSGPAPSSGPPSNDGATAADAPQPGAATPAPGVSTTGPNVAPLPDGADEFDRLGANADRARSANESWAEDTAREHLSNRRDER